MIIRTHSKAGIDSVAIYSKCERYRYSLRRVWNASGKYVLFVMLNPSKATEVQNDPTIERCERRAKALGYGAFCVCNIFAYRETNPKKLRAHPNPNGPDNDSALLDAAYWAHDIICGWGTHGAHRDRGKDVEALLRAQLKPLMHLGLTKAGHPKHPLYIPYQIQPQVWHA